MRISDVSQRDRDLMLILRALNVPVDRLRALKMYLAWAKRSENIGNEDNVANELANIREVLMV
jgi:hypothetical protein